MIDIILMIVLSLFQGIYVKPGSEIHANTLHTSSSGDLASGRAFDSGCVCHQSSEGVKNDLTGKEVTCLCGVS